MHNIAATHMPYPRTLRLGTRKQLETPVVLTLPCVTQWMCT